MKKSGAFSMVGRGHKNSFFPWPKYLNLLHSLKQQPRNVDEQGTDSVVDSTANTR